MEIKNTSKKFSFSAELLGQVDGWLENLGINFQNSRFGNAKRILKQWEMRKLEPTLDDLWSVKELYDLVELYNSFHESEEIETAFLKEISAGSNFLSDEMKSRARDLFFEAKTAARFKRAGFSVLQNPAHDVMVEINGMRFGIECKRPLNNKMLISKIKYAYSRQLNKLPDRLNQGVIFIDLGRMLYNKFSEELSKRENPLPFTTEEVLAEYRDYFDTKCRNLIQKEARDVTQGVSMIVTHYNFPVLMENEEGGYDFSTFNHFCMMTNNKAEYTDTLASALRESVGVQCE